MWLARLRSSLFSVWLAPLRFTHPTLFRSTPSGSEYKVCSTSGFANAHPEVKHASTLPESLCWFRLPFSSSVWLRCAGSAARLRAVLSVLFVVSVVSVLFSARAALAPLRSSYALSFDPGSAALILRTFVRPPRGRNMRYLLPRDSLALIPRGTVVPFKACFDPLRGSWRWLRPRRLCRREKVLI